MGLGKLGLPLAALLAAAGHPVSGVDKSQGLLESLSEGSFRSTEPGLLDAIIEAKKRKFSFTSSLGDLSVATELIFIVVPTPSESDGRFSNKFVLDSLVEISEYISEAPHRVIVDVVSTVMPGSSLGELIPFVEEKSGKKYPEEFGFAYNPEFIALGSVLKDMQSPDMHLIGCEVLDDGAVIQEVLESITLSKVPARIMSLPEAEITKIAINNFITTKISFANMLYQASLKMPGTNVDVISGALGLDSRIGPKYIKGGAPYGGPCFPRDTRALAVFLDDLGVDAGIPRATDLANQNHAKALAAEAIAMVEIDNPRILILGVSYKAFSQVTDDSPALAIGAHLSDKGAEVFYWDPESSVPASIGLKNTVSDSEFDEFLGTCDLTLVTRPMSDAPEVSRRLSELPRVFNLWER